MRQKSCGGCQSPPRGEHVCGTWRSRDHPRALRRSSCSSRTQHRRLQTESATAKQDGSWKVSQASAAAQRERKESDRTTNKRHCHHPAPGEDRATLTSPFHWCFSCPGTVGGGEEGKGQRSPGGRGHSSSSHGKNNNK